MKRPGHLAALVVVCVAVALAGPLRVVAASGGSEMQGAFVSLMVANRQWVLARLLQPLMLDGRYAVLQTRVAERWAPDKWRLTDESTWVVDCAAPGRRLAVVQRATNAEPDGSLPPRWQVTPGMGADTAGLALASLVFEDLPVPRFSHSWPQSLRSPEERRVGAEFACRAANLPGSVPWPEVEVAALLRQTGGFDDTQALRCSASGRANPTGVDIEIRHSPAGQAVMLGEKWVDTGALHEDHLAFADGDLEVRLIRNTGMLRLVLRSELLTVGTGVCRTLQAPASKIPGW